MAVSAAPLPAEQSTAGSAFAWHLEERGLRAVERGRIETLQVNIGKRCNLACHHCHVEAGPNRRERLDRRGCERIVELLELNPGITTLDLTGGAPELHEHFRFLVRRARSLGKRVIDRCNLTVLFERGQEDTADFLAEHTVELVASLPCYSVDNVEKQRGRGVFDKSIEALRRLNRLGYGMTNRCGRGLPLNLVYNPVGPFLPPSQEQLERSYREQLREHFGIEFDSLLTITNMPIKRFANQLLREKRFDEYMSLLVDNFNANTLPGLMCRSLLSVDHTGRFFDCDFNQALDIDVAGGELTIWNLDDLSKLEGELIATAEHCFGCTAGAGSSCGGALSRDG